MYVCVLVNPCKNIYFVDDTHTDERGACKQKKESERERVCMCLCWLTHLKVTQTHTHTHTDERASMQARERE